MSQTLSFDSEEIKQLSECVWFDKASRMFIVIVDRVTLTIEMSEFLYLASDIQEASGNLFSDPDFLISVSGSDEGIGHMFYVPDNDEVN